MSANGNCYHSSKTKLTIDDAKKYCQTAFGSTFVGRIYEPKDKPTHDIVMMITANKMYIQDSLWLGINDKSSEGQFHYNTGGKLLLNKWRGGQYFH